MEKPMVGEIFQGRYLILKELGVGGMGAVFYAKQTDVNRYVALKILLSDKIADQDTVQRFYREFKLLSRLSHQNIMMIYGLALDEHSLPFAICEYIEGISFRRFLLEHDLMSLERLARNVLQICSAMQYAHDIGVVHRDLKPENIMLVNSDGTDLVKVIDFGLSRASLRELGVADELTRTGQLLGTPNYMSPELISAKADHRSDIYSLGCVVFEMLSGELLFNADNSVALMYQHTNCDPASRFAAIKTKVPSGIFRMLSKMLEKDPQKRYQSMNQLAEELNQILAEPAELIDGHGFKEKLLSQSGGLRNKLLGSCMVLLVAITSVALIAKHASKITRRSNADAALIADQNQDSPRRRLQTLIKQATKDCSGRAWKELLLWQRAYTLSTQESKTISRAERLYVTLNFADSLQPQGLSSTAMDLCNKVEAHVKAHGLTVQSTGTYTPIADFYYIELLKSRILTDWGKLDEAKALLAGVIAKDPPTLSLQLSRTIDCALRLSDESLRMKIMPECKTIMCLVQVSQVYRSYNKLAWAAETMANARKKTPKDVAEAVLLKTESANVCLALGQTEASLRYLDDVIELVSDKLADKKAIEFVKPRLAESLAFAGKPELSIRYLQMASAESTEKIKQNQLNSGNIDKKLSKANVVTALESTIANTTEPAVRCELFCRLAESSESSKARCYSCYAYDLCKHNPTEITGSLKMKCFLLYGNALREFGLISQSIEIYESVLKMNARVSSSAAPILSNEIDLNSAKIGLANNFIDSFETTKCRKILDEMMQSLSDASPRDEILRLELKLARFGNALKLIESCPSTAEACVLTAICMDAGQFALAEKAVLKGYKCLDKTSKTERNYLELRLGIRQAFLLIEEHRKSEAQKILLRLKNIDLPKTGKEMIEVREELECALALSDLQLDSDLND